MGAVFFLMLWPLLLVSGLFYVILPFIPYIVMATSLFWLLIGLLLRYIFIKHNVYDTGLNDERRPVNVLTEILIWVVRIDIVVNIVLIVGAVAAAIIFATKGITIFWLVPNQLIEQDKELLTRSQAGGQSLQAVI